MFVTVLSWICKGSVDLSKRAIVLSTVSPSRLYASIIFLVCLVTFTVIMRYCMILPVFKCVTSHQFPSLLRWFYPVYEFYELLPNFYQVFTENFYQTFTKFLRNFYRIFTKNLQEVGSQTEPTPAGEILIRRTTPTPTPKNFRGWGGENFRGSDLTWHDLTWLTSGRVRPHLTWPDLTHFRKGQTSPDMTWPDSLQEGSDLTWHDLTWLTSGRVRPWQIHPRKWPLELF